MNKQRAISLRDVLALKSNDITANSYFLGKKLFPKMKNKPNSQIATIQLALLILIMNGYLKIHKLFSFADKTLIPNLILFTFTNCGDV